MRILDNSLNKSNNLIVGITACVSIIGGICLITKGVQIIYRKIINRKNIKVLENHFCNVCCVEINHGCTEESFSTCSICHKYVCCDMKCAQRVPNTVKWVCHKCCTAKVSREQTSSWVAEQVSFNTRQIHYPDREINEIYIPISDCGDSSMENVSHIGANSTVNSSHGQQLQIWDYVTEVMTNLLSGAFKKTATVPTETHCDKNNITRASEVPQSAQAEPDKASAEVNGNAHHFMYNGIDAACKVATFNHTEDYIKSKIGNIFLETSALNKILDEQGNAKYLSEKTLNVSVYTSDSNSNEENNVTTSNSSIGQQSNYDSSDTDTTTYIELSNEESYSRLSTTEGGAKTVEENGNVSASTQSTLGERIYADNWLLTKKYDSSAICGHVDIFLPDPKEHVSAQIGDIAADEISDLSEMGSDTESSLEFLHTNEEYLNNRLQSRHLIGGYNSKLVLDELIDGASMVSNTCDTPNEASYIETKNERLVDSVPKTEAINKCISQPLKRQREDAAALCEEEYSKETTTAVMSKPQSAIRNQGEIFSPVEIIDSYSKKLDYSTSSSPSRTPSVIEILAAIALGPMLAIPASEQQSVLTQSEINSLKELSDLALADINARTSEINQTILSTIPEESFENETKPQNTYSHESATVDNNLLETSAENTSKKSNFRINAGNTCATFESSKYNIQTQNHSILPNESGIPITAECTHLDFQKEKTGVQGTANSVRTTYDKLKDNTEVTGLRREETNSHSIAESTLTTLDSSKENTEAVGSQKEKIAHQSVVEVLNRLDEHINIIDAQKNDAHVQAIVEDALTICADSNENTKTTGAKKEEIELQAITENMSTIINSSKNNSEITNPQKEEPDLQVNADNTLTTTDSCNGNTETTNRQKEGNELQAIIENASIAIDSSKWSTDVIDPQKQKKENTEKSEAQNKEIDIQKVSEGTTAEHDIWNAHTKITNSQKEETDLQAIAKSTRIIVDSSKANAEIISSQKEETNQHCMLQTIDSSKENTEVAGSQKEEIDIHAIVEITYTTVNSRNENISIFDLHKCKTDHQEITESTPDISNENTKKTYRLNENQYFQDIFKSTPKTIHKSNENTEIGHPENNDIDFEVAAEVTLTRTGSSEENTDRICPQNIGIICVHKEDADFQVIDERTPTINDSSKENTEIEDAQKDEIKLEKFTENTPTTQLTEYKKEETDLHDISESTNITPDISKDTEIEKSENGETTLEGIVDNLPALDDNSTKNTEMTESENKEADLQEISQGVTATLDVSKENATITGPLIEKTDLRVIAGSTSTTLDSLSEKQETDLQNITESIHKTPDISKDTETANSGKGESNLKGILESSYALHSSLKENIAIIESENKGAELQEIIQGVPATLDSLKENAVIIGPLKEEMDLQDIVDNTHKTPDISNDTDIAESGNGESNLEGIVETTPTLHGSSTENTEITQYENKESGLQAISQGVVVPSYSLKENIQVTGALNEESDLQYVAENTEKTLDISTNISAAEYGKEATNPRGISDSTSTLYNNSKENNEITESENKKTDLHEISQDVIADIAESGNRETNLDGIVDSTPKLDDSATKNTGITESEYKEADLKKIPQDVVTDIAESGNGETNLEGIVDSTPALDDSTSKSTEITESEIKEAELQKIPQDVVADAAEFGNGETNLEGIVDSTPALDDSTTKSTEITESEIKEADLQNISQDVVADLAESGNGETNLESIVNSTPTLDDSSTKNTEITESENKEADFQKIPQDVVTDIAEFGNGETNLDGIVDSTPRLDDSATKNTGITESENKEADLQKIPQDVVTDIAEFGNGETNLDGIVDSTPRLDDSATKNTGITESENKEADLQKIPQDVVADIAESGNRETNLDGIVVSTPRLDDSATKNTGITESEYEEADPQKIPQDVVADLAESGNGETNLESIVNSTPTLDDSSTKNTEITESENKEADFQKIPQDVVTDIAEFGNGETNLDGIVDSTPRLDDSATKNTGITESENKEADLQKIPQDVVTDIAEFGNGETNLDGIVDSTPRLDDSATKNTGITESENKEADLQKIPQDVVADIAESGNRETNLDGIVDSTPRLDDSATKNTGITESENKEADLQKIPQDVVTDIAEFGNGETNLDGIVDSTPRLDDSATKNTGITESENKEADLQKIPQDVVTDIAEFGNGETNLDGIVDSTPRLDDSATKNTGITESENKEADLQKIPQDVVTDIAEFGNGETNLDGIVDSTPRLDDSATKNTGITESEYEEADPQKIPQDVVADIADNSATKNTEITESEYEEADLQKIPQDVVTDIAEFGNGETNLEGIVDSTPTIDDSATKNTEITESEYEEADLQKIPQDVVADIAESGNRETNLDGIVVSTPRLDDSATKNTEITESEYEEADPQKIPQDVVADIADNSATKNTGITESEIKEADLQNISQDVVADIAESGNRETNLDGIVDSTPRLDDSATKNTEITESEIKEADLQNISQDVVADIAESGNRETNLDGIVDSTPRLDDSATKNTEITESEIKEADLQNISQDVVADIAKSGNRETNLDGIVDSTPRLDDSATKNTEITESEYEEADLQKIPQDVVTDIAEFGNGETNLKGIVDSTPRLDDSATKNTGITESEYEEADLKKIPQDVVADIAESGNRETNLDGIVDITPRLDDSATKNTEITESEYEEADLQNISQDLDGIVDITPRLDDSATKNTEITESEYEEADLQKIPQDVVADIAESGNRETNLDGIVDSTSRLDDSATKNTGITESENKEADLQKIPQDVVADIAESGNREINLDGIVVSTPRLDDSATKNTEITESEYEEADLQKIPQDVVADIADNSATKNTGITESEYEEADLQKIPQDLVADIAESGNRETNLDGIVDSTPRLDDNATKNTEITESEYEEAALQKIPQDVVTDIAEFGNAETNLEGIVDSTPALDDSTTKSTEITESEIKEADFQNISQDVIADIAESGNRETNLDGIVDSTPRLDDSATKNTEITESEYKEADLQKIPQDVVTDIAESENGETNLKGIVDSTPALNDSTTKSTEITESEIKEADLQNISQDVVADLAESGNRETNLEGIAESAFTTRDSLKGKIDVTESKKKETGIQNTAENIHRTVDILKDTEIAETGNGETNLDGIVDSTPRLDNSATKNTGITESENKEADLQIIPQGVIADIAESGNRETNLDGIVDSTPRLDDSATKNTGITESENKEADFQIIPQDVIADIAESGNRETNLDGIVDSTPALDDSTTKSTEITESEIKETDLHNISQDVVTDIAESGNDETNLEGIVESTKEGTGLQIIAENDRKTADILKDTETADSGNGENNLEGIVNNIPTINHNFKKNTEITQSDQKEAELHEICQDLPATLNSSKENAEVTFPVKEIDLQDIAEYIHKTADILKDTEIAESGNEETNLEGIIDCTLTLDTSSKENVEITESENKRVDLHEISQGVPATLNSSKENSEITGLVKEEIDPQHIAENTNKTPYISNETNIAESENGETNLEGSVDSTPTLDDSSTKNTEITEYENKEADPHEISRGVPATVNSSKENAEVTFPVKEIDLQDIVENIHKTADALKDTEIAESGNEETNLEGIIDCTLTLDTSSKENVEITESENKRVDLHEISQGVPATLNSSKENSEITGLVKEIDPQHIAENTNKTPDISNDTNIEESENGETNLEGSVDSTPTLDDTSAKDTEITEYENKEADPHEISRGVPATVNSSKENAEVTFPVKEIDLQDIAENIHKTADILKDTEIAESGNEETNLEGIIDYTLTLDTSSKEKVEITESENKKVDIHEISQGCPATLNSSKGNSEITGLVKKGIDLQNIVENTNKTPYISNDTNIAESENGETNLEGSADSTPTLDDTSAKDNEITEYENKEADPHEISRGVPATVNSLKENAEVTFPVKEIDLQDIAENIHKTADILKDTEIAESGNEETNLEGVYGSTRTLDDSSTKNTEKTESKNIEADPREVPQGVTVTLNSSKENAEISGPVKKECDLQDIAENIHKTNFEGVVDSTLTLDDSSTKNTEITEYENKEADLQEISQSVSVTFNSSEENAEVTGHVKEIDLQDIAHSASTTIDSLMGITEITEYKKGETGLQNITENIHKTADILKDTEIAETGNGETNHEGIVDNTPTLDDSATKNTEITESENKEADLQKIPQDVIADRAESGNRETNLDGIADSTPRLDDSATKSTEITESEYKEADLQKIPQYVVADLAESGNDETNLEGIVESTKEETALQIIAENSRKTADILKDTEAADSGNGANNLEGIVDDIPTINHNSKKNTEITQYDHKEAELHEICQGVPATFNSSKENAEVTFSVKEIDLQDIAENIHKTADILKDTEIGESENGETNLEGYADSTPTPDGSTTKNTEITESEYKAADLHEISQRVPATLNNSEENAEVTGPIKEEINFLGTGEGASTTLDSLKGDTEYKKEAIGLQNIAEKTHKTADISKDTERAESGNGEINLESIVDSTPTLDGSSAKTTEITESDNKEADLHEISQGFPAALNISEENAEVTGPVKEIDLLDITHSASTTIDLLKGNTEITESKKEETGLQNITENTHKTADNLKDTEIAKSGNGDINLEGIVDSTPTLGGNSTENTEITESENKEADLHEISKGVPATRNSSKFNAAITGLVKEEIELEDIAESASTILTNFKRNTEVTKSENGETSLENIAESNHKTSNISKDTEVADSGNGESSLENIIESTPTLHNSSKENTGITESENIETDLHVMSQDIPADPRRKETDYQDIAESTSTRLDSSNENPEIKDTQKEEINLQIIVENTHTTLDLLKQKNEIKESEKGEIDLEYIVISTLIVTDILKEDTAIAESQNREVDIQSISQGVRTTLETPKENTEIPNPHEETVLQETSESTYALLRESKDTGKTNPQEGESRMQVIAENAPTSHVILKENTEVREFQQEESNLKLIAQDVLIPLEIADPAKEETNHEDIAERFDNLKENTEVIESEKGDTELHVVAECAPNALHSSKENTEERILQSVAQDMPGLFDNLEVNSEIKDRHRKKTDLEEISVSALTTPNHFKEYNEIKDSHKKKTDPEVIAESNHITLDIIKENTGITKSERGKFGLECIVESTATLLDSLNENTDITESQNKNLQTIAQSMPTTLESSNENAEMADPSRGETDIEGIAEVTPTTFDAFENDTKLTETIALSMPTTLESSKENAEMADPSRGETDIEDIDEVTPTTFDAFENDTKITETSLKTISESMHPAIVCPKENIEKKAAQNYSVLKDVIGVQVNTASTESTPTALNSDTDVTYAQKKGIDFQAIAECTSTTADSLKANAEITHSHKEEIEHHEVSESVPITTDDSKDYNDVPDPLKQETDLQTVAESIPTTLDLLKENSAITEYQKQEAISESVTTKLYSSENDVDITHHHREESDLLAIAESTTATFNRSKANTEISYSQNEETDLQAISECAPTADDILTENSEIADTQNKAIDLQAIPETVHLKLETTTHECSKQNIEVPVHLQHSNPIEETDQQQNYYSSPSLLDTPKENIVIPNLHSTLNKEENVQSIDSLRENSEEFIEVMGFSEPLADKEVLSENETFVDANKHTTVPLLKNILNIPKSGETVCEHSEPIETQGLIVSESVENSTASIRNSYKNTDVMDQEILTYEHKIILEKNEICDFSRCATEPLTVETTVSTVCGMIDPLIKNTAKKSVKFVEPVLRAKGKNDDEAVASRTKEFRTFLDSAEIKPENQDMTESNKNSDNMNISESSIDQQCGLDKNKISEISAENVNQNNLIKSDEYESPLSVNSEIVQVSATITENKDLKNQNNIDVLDERAASKENNQVIEKSLIEASNSEATTTSATSKSPTVDILANTLSILDGSASCIIQRPSPDIDHLSFNLYVTTENHQTPLENSTTPEEQSEYTYASTFLTTTTNTSTNVITNKVLANNCNLDHDAWYSNFDFNNMENCEDNDVPLLKRFIPGSIAEREYKKWEKAVEMPNNPYTPEALRRRISGTDTSFINLPKIGSNHEISITDTMDAEYQSHVDELKRYGRDYYINDNEQNISKCSYNDKHLEMGDRSVKEEYVQQTGNEIYQALPARIVDDTATVSEQSIKSVGSTPNIESQEKTTDFKEDLKVKKQKTDITDRPSGQQSENSSGTCIFSRGSTPASFKFLQPKRKLIDSSQVLSIDDSEIQPHAVDKKVIEEDIAHVLPSVKALAQAFLLTSAKCSQTEGRWRTKVKNLSKLPKSDTFREPDAISLSNRKDSKLLSSNVTDEKATAKANLDNLQTNPSFHEELMTDDETSTKPTKNCENDNSSPSVLQNNIAFFENLKFK